MPRIVQSPSILSLCLVLGVGGLLLAGLGPSPLGAQPLRPRLATPVPTEVSMIYEKGVNYLINQQNQEGHWGNEMLGDEPAVVALALLATLAHGKYDTQPRYKSSVERSMSYILQAQDDTTGYIGDSMYNHGFCTLALAECYGQLDNHGLGQALQSAVDLILKAQTRNPKKAWRYNPDSVDADSTVTGCQLVALFAARNAGINVPQESLEQGLAYLESCRTKQASYGYSDASGGKPTLTAIAVLCHTLNRTEPTETLQESIDFLSRRLNYRDPHYPFYFEYYMSQALFQSIPEIWEDWNKRNLRYLKLVQRPNGSWESNYGTVYSTSTALLSIALNYRLLPIYERF